MKKNSEKVYVKVTSEFDSTGYMQPTSITWTDALFPLNRYGITALPELWISAETASQS